jgi:hypothetical protein
MPAELHHTAKALRSSAMASFSIAKQGYGVA